LSFYNFSFPSGEALFLNTISALHSTDAKIISIKIVSFVTDGRSIFAPSVASNLSEKINFSNQKGHNW
jgi:hypothetical protein